MKQFVQNVIKENSSDDPGKKPMDEKVSLCGAKYIPEKEA